jgi:hypothetical protein
VQPSAPLAYTRLALASAWRAGVRCFVLVLAEKSQPSEAATHELEQELRVLLDTLGDGGGAPCVRAALTRDRGTITSDMRPAMVRLLDEIERVFSPGDGGAIDEPLPESFADEVEMLDAVAPLIRAGTMIGKGSATLAQTAALRAGAGGSHHFGWPYEVPDEPRPTCPECRGAMACCYQFDMRDVLHTPPPAHQLFVVYRCGKCHYARTVIPRHYTPMASRPRPFAPRGDDDESRCALIVMKRRGYMLPPFRTVEGSYPEIIEALSRIDPDGSRLYWWVDSATGLGSLRLPDHLGGWTPTAEYEPEPTCACRATLALVASTDCWGTERTSIWACPLHPDVLVHRQHK